MALTNTEAEGKVALYENTGDWAFGPVFDNAAQAEDFIAYCNAKGVSRPDSLSMGVLRTMHDAWYAQFTAEPHDDDVDWYEKGMAR